MVKRRILIKDRASMLFFMGLDQWTASEQKALAFSNMREAQKVIQRAQLRGVEVVSELC